MDFYRKAGRENLPWRKPNITAYEVWVSEIMLQQTQVSRVIGYYTKFLERFPTAADLARASWEDFLPYYAGLGYYRRGQNMLLAARKVMTEFGSGFPRDKKLLMSLPGVGDYTASAILSFAYGQNAIAWDTNLKRVIGRFFFGSKNADSSELIFDVHAKELNAALMDFGSALCLGRPKCSACPLSAQCVYFIQEGNQEKVRVTPDSIRNPEILDSRVNPEDDRFVARDSKKIHWRNARVYLWLHKDHKLYYSSNQGRFEVFVLPETYNSRAGIKAYFKEKYSLDLAVRPPHEKRVIHDKPTLFVNAQILLGNPSFATFSKAEVKQYNESVLLKELI